MKALVLSGGTGTRLRPFTYTGAKQLLPVANKPVLYYALESIREAGITDLGLVVGETRQEVMAAVGDGSQWGIRVTYIEQEAPLGLAHAVKVARPYLGEEPFLMFLGDNLLRERLRDPANRFSRALARGKGPSALVLLGRVPDPQRFGVAEVQNDRVIRLVEKPRVPPSDLALVGVYLFDHHIHRAVEDIKPSWRGELEITDAIQWLIDRGLAVEYHLVTGWWKDIGRPEDLLEANRLMLGELKPGVKGEVDGSSRLEGRVRVERGARIISSLVRGPAVIGEGSLVVHSYVGPFSSLGPGAMLRGSEIENSVVLAEAVIADVEGRIEGSIIGRGAVLERKGGFPRTLRVVVGDRSHLCLA